MVYSIPVHTSRFSAPFILVFKGASVLCGPESSRAFQSEALDHSFAMRFRCNEHGFHELTQSTFVSAPCPSNCERGQFSRVSLHMDFRRNAPEGCRLTAILFVASRVKRVPLGACEPGCEAIWLALAHLIV